MPPENEMWIGLAARLGINAQQPVVIVALATLLVILITTKLTSGHAASPSDGNGKSVPPASGHWIPWLGNAPFLAWGQTNFLAGFRDRFDGIFSFTVMGKTHHFLHKPSMVSAYFNLQHAGEEDHFMRDHVFTGAFGMPKADLPICNGLSGEIRLGYNKHLLAESALSEITDATLRLIRRNIAEFVTFNSYPADQAEWERLAGADLMEDIDGEGTQAVEVDLMELVRSFVGRTATPALFGTDFVDNFPEVLQLNWIVDAAFLPLALGCPGWIPWPRVQRAKLARRKMHASLREFHEALDKHLDGQDPGPQWDKLDNVSGLLKDRAKLWRKHDVSHDGRAAVEQAFLWASMANSNPLIGWMLFEVCRDAVLLERIREEIAPYVQAVQPKNEFGAAVWVSPELHAVDMEGLTTKCPLIKAAYVETLRVYTSTWSMTWMPRDTVLQEREKDGRSWVLKGGSCAHLPMELHNFDANYFADPREWQVERHLKETVNEKGVKVLTADMGTVRPYGGGLKMCKGRAFALRELILYVAVIVSFYDIVPIKGGSWPRPKLWRGAGTSYPTKPLRVWIKKRKIEPTA